MRVPGWLAVLCVLCVLGGLASSCGGEGSDNGAGGVASRSGLLRVTVPFYPVEEAVRAIGGDRVEVNELTPVGAEPHGLELKPAQLEKLEAADVALYLGAGFQPSVEKAVSATRESVEKVDLLDGLKLRPADVGIPGVRGEVDGGQGPESLKGGRDPHVWVDPGRFSTMVRRIERALMAADPDGRPTYQTNAEAYLAKLSALDADFKRGLSDCGRRCW